MRIGLVGQSYQEASLPLDAQRMVNLYVVQAPQGKEQSAVYGTPGLLEFASVGTAKNRKSFVNSTGRAFIVSGSKVYELLADGNYNELGSLMQSSGIVYMEDNGFELAICDTRNIYIYNYSSGVFTKATLPSGVVAGTLTFIDGYFVISDKNTGKFYLSGLYNGLSWGALDFATAENSPDNLERVYNAIGQLWLLGTFTTEIWTNTGSSSFPFEKINTKIDIGILAPSSAVDINDSLFFVGRDKSGNARVYNTVGFRAKPVSTPPIEIILRKAGDLSKVVAYKYHQDGHTFYILTGGNLPTSLCFDLTTQLWHERAYLNEFGSFEQHLALDHMFAFNKHLVISRKDSKVYEMSPDYYTDDGDSILRERIMTNLSDMNRKIRYNSLEIDLETGVGLQNGQGSEPLISLMLSKDGSRTWSNPYQASIGKVGEYQTKVEFRRLGVAETMTFKLQISEPVKIAIIGAYVNVS